MGKKIAIITSTFPPYRGGIGKLAELDAVQLAALGHEVHVFTPQPATGGAASAAGYRVHELRPWLRFGNAALVPGAAGVARDFPVVLLNYPFFGGAEFIALAKRFFPRSRLAIIYHMDVVGQGAFRTQFFRWHTRWCLPRILLAADRVVVTSFDYLMSSNIAGFFRDQRVRFRELAPSIDVGRFSPGGKPPALLARYGLGVTDRIILFVGGLDQPHYFKGVPSLLRAMTVKELARAKAVIVGQGDLRPEFERLAIDLGIDQRVIFTGGVSEEELPDHYCLADVFAFPSIDKSEAFGVAALEALASGVPVVASDLPGVRTIVRHGETGYCVPPGSVSGLAARLDRLLDDAVLRQRLGAGARKMVVEEYAHGVRQKRLSRIVADLTAESGANIRKSE